MRVFRAWTIGRAAGAGAVAGLSALLLWPIYAVGIDVLPLFLIALITSAFCGLSLLVITLIDLAVHRRRGSRLRPIRAFDLILGLALAVPSLVELRIILPDFVLAAGLS
jgi:hypothetical protein